MAELISNIVSKQIWNDRYKKDNETPLDNIKRVAKFVANNEEEEKQFMNCMSDKLFIGAGRTMSNAGLPNLTLNNCFTSNFVPDSMEGIFESVKLNAIVHQKGGGNGWDFSKIRPKGTKTSNHAVASGVVSFMNVFDSQTQTVMQGSRRGANMGILNIYHPDIFDFLEAKSWDKGKLTQFNLSIMIDDAFMTAKDNNEMIYLHYPVYDDNGYIIVDETKWTHKKMVNAKDLYEKIIHKAYDTGEYGVLFYDNLNLDNNTYYCETIVNSNPCGEYVSGLLFLEHLESNNYKGACNLASLLLHNFIIKPFTKEAKFDYKKLEQTIPILVRFLDNIIDKNHYPTKEFENYQKAMRTIGLGITGLADTLTMLNMKYGDDNSIKFIDELMNEIALQSYKASIELAKEKGSFELLDKSQYVKSGFIQKHLTKDIRWQEIVNDILQYGIRNARLLSVAPTGTMSLTWGENCSSGLEPIFSLEQKRLVKVGGQDEENKQEFILKDYAYELWQNTKKDNIVKENIFVTTSNLTPMEHLKVLKTIAFHVDMSCSKTINVPTEYTFEQTKGIYDYCHKNWIKGCTIFRPNELRQGILSDNKKSGKIIENKTIDKLERGYILDVSDDLLSAKRTITSGCGKFYLHVDFDELTGEPMETFIDVGSGGGCERNLQFISRLMSLALRSGVPIEAIIDQAKSIKPCTSYCNKINKVSKGSSCPSAIGFTLEELYEKIQDRCFSDDYITEEETKEIRKIKYPCPECGDELTFEGGCNVCKSCGFTKCE